MKRSKEENDINLSRDRVRFEDIVSRSPDVSDEEKQFARQYMTVQCEEYAKKSGLSIEFMAEVIGKVELAAKLTGVTLTTDEYSRLVAMLYFANDRDKNRSLRLDDHLALFFQVRRKIGEANQDSSRKTHRTTSKVRQ